MQLTIIFFSKSKRKKKSWIISHAITYCNGNFLTIGGAREPKTQKTRRRWRTAPDFGCKSWTCLNINENIGDVQFLFKDLFIYLILGMMLVTVTVVWCWQLANVSSCSSEVSSVYSEAAMQKFEMIRLVSVLNRLSNNKHALCSRDCKRYIIPSWLVNSCLKPHSFLNRKWIILMTVRISR